jgi:DNA-binding NarL/FixJ family response regulator
LATFTQYDINLVILDLDLDDCQGDGAILLRDFRLRKPGITVLANSSEQKYNDILLKGGAKVALAKDTSMLRRWLTDNG